MKAEPDISMPETTPAIPDEMIRYGILCVILWILYLISTSSYLLFHGIVELAGIAVAASIFILIWNTRRVIPDAFFLIIGISFLFIGGIDLAHTLAYKGMGIFPGNSADIPTQLWIAARYFQSITFLIATLFIGRFITKNRNADAAIILSLCTAACTLIFVSIFIWDNFPPCFIEGSGLTPFKIYSEYFISLILIATIVLLYRKREHFDPGVWKLLIAAQVFLILGELSFTTYASVYGFTNMLGHLFRLVSVYLFYRAIVVVALTRPYDLLLYDLQREQAALRKSEEKYRTLFDNMLEGFAYCRMIYDQKGEPSDWIYLDVNAAFERLTGLREIAGKRVLEAIPNIRELTPELFDTYGRVASTGVAETFEIDFKPLKMWLRVSVFSPKKDHFVAVFEDITDQHRAQEAIQQANQKLNLLSSITRHDIRNQLFTLKAYLELSKESLGDAGKTAEYIIKEERAADSIERQIAFTKEYEDLGVREPVWQPVGPCIRHAVEHLPLREVGIVYGVGSLEVYADPLFEKVFYNLIDNALHHGGPSMTRIAIYARESGNNMVLCIEDNGTGISKDDKKHLFSKGFGKHTGLGLFLSREILAITGISIAENGEPGNGARFELTVPEGGWRMGNPEGP